LRRRHVGGEISAALEGSCIPDYCAKGRRVRHAHLGNPHRPPRDFVLARILRERIVERFDLWSEGIPFCTQIGDRRHFPGVRVKLRIGQLLVEDVGKLPAILG
jgi:hypothetical protein